MVCKGLHTPYRGQDAPCSKEVALHGRSCLEADSTCAQVRVVSPGSQDFLVERLKLVAQIRSAKIPAGTSKQIKPGFMDEIKRAEKDGIPVVVIMGEEELRKVSASCVKMMNMREDSQCKLCISMCTFCMICSSSGSRGSLASCYAQTRLQINKVHVTPSCGRILFRFMYNANAQGVVKVRNQWREKEHPHREMEVPQPQLVERLLQIIAENGSRNAPFTKPYIGSIW